MVQVIFEKGTKIRLQRKLDCTHMPGTSQNVYLNLTKSKFYSQNSVQIKDF